MFALIEYNDFRITKYPLLIEPLIKTSKERPAEQEQLRQANALVRVSPSVNSINQTCV